MYPSMLLRRLMLGVVGAVLSVGAVACVSNTQLGAASSAIAPLPASAPHLVIEAGGHTAIIRKLLFSADGRELISVSDDKTIRVWTVSPDGRHSSLARTLRGQLDAGEAGTLYAAALSPADAGGRQRWLAVAGLLAGEQDEDRYAVRLHDYASGDVVALLHGHRDKVFALAFAPTEHWLASAGKDNTIRLWDLTALQGNQVTRGPLVLNEHTDHIYDLAWSPTGNRLASASYDTTVGLWNTEYLAQGTVTLLARLRGHHKPVPTVAFHPDGTVLASGSKDQTIRLWQAQDGTARGVFAQTAQEVTALAFAPTGQWLLAGRIGGSDNPKRITLYTYPAGTEYRLFTEHQNIVLATAFHPSGQWVASGGGNEKEILLWEVQTEHVLSHLQGGGTTVWAVGFAPDGQTLSWGQTFVHTSEINRGPLEHRFDLNTLTRLAGAIPATSAVRARDHLVSLWLETERSGALGYTSRLHVWQGQKRLSTIERGATDGYQHTAYTFTPDAKHVLSGGFNGVLRLYALDGVVRANLIGHTGEIKAVAVAADGRWALSGASDQTLNLWSLEKLPASGSTDIWPILTLFPATNGEWVAWTPEGFFTGSAKGAYLVGYSVNQGVEKLSQYVAVDQLYERFYRPDLILAKLQGDPQGLWKKEGALTDAKTVLAQSGLPPEVTFVAPAVDTTVTQPEFDAQITLADQGGGLGTVVWKVSGITVAVFPPAAPEPGVASSTTSPAPFRLIQRLILSPGQNTLEVVAYNGRDEVASPPVTRTLMFEPQAPVAVAQAPSVALTTGAPPALPTVDPERPPQQAQAVSPSAFAPAVSVPLHGSPTMPTSPAIPPVGPALPSASPGVSNPPPPLRHKVIPLPLPVLHVLSVGINLYRDKALWLRYAVPDAQVLTQTLSDVATPLFRAIDVTLVLDEQATLAGIAAAFKDMTERTTPDDVFVLYLSGHGVTRDGHYYFLPQDLRYRNDEPFLQEAITQDHLQQWLATIRVRKSLILIDTCESGSLIHTTVAMRGMAEKTAVAKLIRATGRAMIVASTETQPAFEGYQEHGVFTYTILQGLHEADARFGNRDGITSIFELAAYVDDQVPAITKKVFGFEQFPQVQMVGQDFPIGMVLGKESGK